MYKKIVGKLRYKRGVTKTERIKPRSRLEDVYDKFMVYLSRPHVERCEMLGIQMDPNSRRYVKEPTQKAFAEYYGVSEFTLIKWKQSAGFMDKVDYHRKNWGIEKVPNVLAALYNRCIKHGMAQDVELFLKYYVNWNPKSNELEKNNPANASGFTLDDIRHLISLLPASEQVKAYESIANIILKAESIGAYGSSQKYITVESRNDTNDVRKEADTSAQNPVAVNQVPAQA